MKRAPKSGRKTRRSTVRPKQPSARQRSLTPSGPRSPQEQRDAAKPPPIHVLIRVRSENGQTIDAHARMVATHGAAVFGKLGQPVGPSFRDALNQQIADGTKTYLFITTREGWNGPYVTDRCSLKQVHESLDAAKRHLVPKYYIGEAGKIRTWFEVSDVQRLSRDEMNRIFVLSSGRSIMSVIKSTAAVFRVGVGDVNPNGTDRQSSLRSGSTR